MASQGENQSLSALRTLAAVTVVVGHTRRFLLQGGDGASGSVGTDLAYLLTSLERGAVLVFFVLSGYFVGGSVLRGARRGRFSWLDFTVARLTRLWIVLVPALVLTVVADAVGRRLTPGSYLYQEYDTTLGEVVGSVFFLQLSVVGIPGTNTPLWSLAFEALYYAVFPLVLIGLLGRGSGPRLLSAAALGVLVLVAFPPAWLLLPVWLLGAAVARAEPWVVARLRRLAPGTRAGVQCLAVVLCALGWLADRGAGHAHVYDVAPVTYVFAALFALLLCVLLDDLHPRRRAPRAALAGLARYAGASYSLYAIHLPLLALVATTLQPVASRSERWAPGVGSWTAVGAVVVLLVVAGWAFAAVTERHTDRVRRWVTDRLYRSSTNESSTRRNPTRS